MKKEFTFYEFVGILVPGVTLLFFTELLIEQVYGKTIIDFSKVGESAIFLVVAYGVGHILQAAGNIFENIMWFIFGGMPTKWLTNKNRFGCQLIQEEQAEKIKTKIFNQFGKMNMNDYGRCVYNWLSMQDKVTEKRIDVFMANYSQFRGLTVSFYILAVIVLLLLGWKFMLIPLVLGLLSNYRMYRFAKLYAVEVFLTYLNME